MKEIPRSLVVEAAAFFLAELIAREAVNAPSPSNTLGSVLALTLLKDGGIPISALEQFYCSEGLPSVAVQKIITHIERKVTRIEEIQNVPTF